MMCNNIICLSYIKNKNTLIYIEIFLKLGCGKLFYKNLLDLKFINSINISYAIINNYKKLSNYDIYINVKPDNVKKIGDSCGLAIFINLFALILKLKLVKNLAATGSIDNNINLIQSANLKIKLNFYNSIKLIILPKTNDDIYNNKFKLIYVNSIKDVINLVKGI